MLWSLHPKDRRQMQPLLHQGLHVIFQIPTQYQLKSDRILDVLRTITIWHALCSYLPQHQATPACVQVYLYFNQFVGRDLLHFQVNTEEGRE